jgi:hypothetical protein
MIYNIVKGQWARVHDSTSDIVDCGSFTPDKNGLLKHIKIGFLKHSANGKFRVRLHTSRNYTRIYAQSELIDLSEIKFNLYTGQVRFDFLKDVNILNGVKYYVTIESADYTRIADTNFVAWIHDHAYTTNVSTGNWPSEFPIKMELFIK